MTAALFIYSLAKSRPPVKQAACTEPIRLFYLPAPKSAGFLFVQATLHLLPN